jgi:protein-S-isoprenylcysteine O-methyltransferase Ste14
MIAAFLLLQGLFASLILVRLLWPRPRQPSGAASIARTAVRDDRASPILVLHALGWLGLYAAVAHAVASGAVAEAPPRAVLGAFLLIAGGVLGAWAFSTLRSWRLRPAIDPGHELSTTGPYALVRHPNYLALDLVAVGSAVWAFTVPMVLAAVVVIVAGDLRARAEEQVLLQAFGDAYRDYARRVNRLLPGIY